MNIRKFQQGEEHILWDIFYKTIHHINANDYSQNQINAWAPRNFDKSIWHKKVNDINPYVVIHNSTIIAYADIQKNGYIDHFFCHYKYQNKGIGSKLFSHLAMVASKNGIIEMSADVSITARPFFESKGFVVRQEQVISVRGEELVNFKMVRIYDHG